MPLPDEVYFTTNEAEGAIRNGTRVVKVGREAGDSHDDGAPARVIGSLGPIPFRGMTEVYGYWVEWDDMPEVPVFIVGHRIRVQA